MNEQLNSSDDYEHEYDDDNVPEIDTKQSEYECPGRENAFDRYEK